MDGERVDRWGWLVEHAATRRRVAKAAGAGLVAVAVGGRAGAAPRRAQDATPAGCPATTPEENKAIVARYWAEVWTAGGEGAVADLLAEDELHHWGVGDDTVGREAFSARLGTFLTAFPDFTVRVEQVVAEGDLVVSRYTATATHRGAWLGIPATGTAVEYTGINVFRIACGKIAESWGEADHLGLLRQLGGLPNVATPVATPTS